MYRLNDSRALRIRRAVATLGSLAASVLLAVQIHSHGMRTPQILLLASLVSAPALAGVCIWSRRLEAQLFARAVWWSLLLAGSLVCTVVGDEVTHGFAGIVGGMALGLLVMGNVGLDANNGHFQPVGFRGTLLLSLVLAIADTGALLWFGIGSLMFEPRSGAVLLLVPGMAAAVVGLLRLRTWGLLLGIASNVLVALVAYSRIIHFPAPLRALFIATATLQLLVPIPMVVAIIRRRPPAPARYPRLRAAARALVVAGIACVSFYAAFLHDGALLRF
jgi:hypothetical protein